MISKGAVSFSRGTALNFRGRKNTGELNGGAGASVCAPFVDFQSPDPYLSSCPFGTLAGGFKEFLI